ncbi:hypothetical protein V4S31_00915 [Enterococcus cecorum]
MFERLSNLEQLCVKLSYLPLSIQKKWRAFGYFVAHPLTELAQQGTNYYARITNQSASRLVFALLAGIR